MPKRSVLFIMVVCAMSIFAVVSSQNFFALAMGVNQTGITTTSFTTISTSLSPRQQLINQSFTVPSTTGTSLQCELWNFTFTGNQGQYVSGNFTANSPLDFYLVQDTNYQNWLKQGTCGSATEAIASSQLTMSYNFSTALPNSGKWDFVLVNSSNTNNAGGSITAYLSSVGYTMTEVMPNTITTTGLTPGTTETTQPPAATASTNIPGFPIESILAGIAVGLFAVLILRFRKRP